MNKKRTVFLQGRRGITTEQYLRIMGIQPSTGKKGYWYIGTIDTNNTVYRHSTLDNGIVGTNYCILLKQW